MQGRYHSVSIILHWIMAIAILLMLTSGLVMEWVELEKSTQFKLYQWHKSLGVLVLCVVVLRIGWRFTHKAPALPEHFKKLEKFAAKSGHIALYVAMIALPLSGWVMVSSSVYGLPTIVFGWFEWPHLPDISGNKEINSLAKDAHEILAYIMIGLIVIHVAAVIKHAVVDRENLLFRMWWRR